LAPADRWKKSLVHGVVAFCDGLSEAEFRQRMTEGPQAPAGGKEKG